MKCNCGSDKLKFSHIDFSLGLFNFVFNCNDCSDTVSDFRVPTLNGYKSVNVEIEKEMQK